MVNRIILIKKTGESTWKRPHEVLYWLPEKTRKKFDEEEIRGFEEDFAAFDLDASGAIDERELMLCFKDMKIEIDGKRLRKLLASVDEDGSGTIDREEFEKWAQEGMQKVDAEVSIYNISYSLLLYVEIVY